MPGDVARHPLFPTYRRPPRQEREYNQTDMAQQIAQVYQRAHIRLSA
jgi:hypothetical protein